MPGMSRSRGEGAASKQQGTHPRWDPNQDPSSSSCFNPIQFLSTILLLLHLSFMQAAGRVGQLKRIVKSKKMGSTQQQLFVLFVVFLLSPVAPQVRASSFFPSSALSVSNPSPSATYHCTTPARQYQTQKSTQSDFVSGTDMLHILNN